MSTELKPRVYWWLVFRSERKNPTWRFDNHCVLIDAVRACTKTEAELQATDRNPCRAFQRLELRLAACSGTAAAVRAARDKQVKELKAIIGSLH